MSGPDLKPFFHPGAVALIGASADATSINGRPIANLILHQFAGRIYPINPKYREVQGYQAYPSVREVPEPVDVAMIAVNASRVMQSLEESAAAGVKFALVFSAGFAETGQAEGTALQARMKDLSARSGMRIIGPNCIGCLNVIDKIPLGFATPFSNPSFPTGPISFVSQSGAFGYAFLTLAGEHSLGFRYVGNPGNQADIDAVDFLQFFAEDPETKIVVGYIEGIKDGAKFVQAAETCVRNGKPMVIFKAGRSRLGQKAAISHTASLAGSETAFDAIAQRYGVISVHDVDELLDILKSLVQGKLPDPGAGVGIVTVSGASGIMTADACSAEGVAVASLSEATRQQLDPFIPAFGSTLNPVDLTAMVLNDDSLYIKAFDVMRQAPEVGALAVMLSSPTGAMGDRIISDLKATAEQTGKPIVVAATTGERYTEEFRQQVQELGLPVFTSPGRVVRALRHLYEYAAARERLAARGEAVPPAFSPDHQLLTQEMGGGWSEVRVKGLLQAYGIPTPTGGVARSEAEAEQIAARIGYPVVVKAVSPDLLHKTEAGAVRLGINGPEALRAACLGVETHARRALDGAPIEGVLVEKMLPGVVETFAAVKVDPIMGPLVGFGLGGINVEVYQDVAWWPAPLTVDEAHQLMQQVKGYKLLTGYRGRPVADTDALADLLVRLSWLGVELADKVAEVEINPLAVLPRRQGVRALDGVLIPAARSANR